MARGEFLRSAFRARKRTGKWEDADISQFVADLERWSQTLPIASCGFRVARTSAQSIGAATDTRIGWTTKVLDREGWFNRGARFDVVAPPNTGGQYIINLYVRCAITASAATVFVRIVVNGVAVAEERVSATTMVTVTAICDLSPGDTIEAWFDNQTAGAISLAIVNPATATDPQAPTLEAWRIAMPSTMNNEP